MTVLTYNEGVVVDIVRLHSRCGDPVSAQFVRGLAHRGVGLSYDQFVRGLAHRGVGLSYDQVNHALSGLVAKGVLARPTRGFYLQAARTGMAAS